MAASVLHSLARCRSVLPLFQRLTVPGKLSSVAATPATTISGRNLHSSRVALYWNSTRTGIRFGPCGSGRAMFLRPNTAVSGSVAARFMAALAMTKKHVRERVMLNLQLFDKVNPEKLTLDSHFHKDLGLDSLDHVEVIMAIEDEFGFEIPDRDAQRLLTPGKIAQYVCDKYDVFDEDEDHHGHGHDEHGHDPHAQPEDPWADNKPYNPAGAHH